jgi:CheY-like chemotaxis protein
MTEFSGLRVLVVEDEGGVALMIEDMLERLGCEVVGSAARLHQAFELARTVRPQLAMLDVNVAGELVFPLASDLHANGVPIVFSTGYGASGIPPEFSRPVVLAKPFTADELRLALTTALISKPVA